MQATAGQSLTIFASNTSTNPAGQGISYTVYNAAQQTVSSGSISNFGTINMPVVTTTGAYQVVVAPGSGVTGTVQLSLGSGNVLVTNGQAGVQSGFTAGQNDSINFTANAGDNLELTLSNLALSGTGLFESVTVNVLDPNGTNVGTEQCYTSGGNSNQSTCRLPLWNLVQGTYTVVVSPPNSSTAITSFNTTLQADTVGATLALNAATTVTLGVGEVERLTFAGTAGENLSLAVAAVSTTNPTGLPVTLAVYQPGGTITPSGAYMSGQYTGSGTLDMTNLPISGTYTVVISTGGTAADAQLTLGSQ